MIKRLLLLLYVISSCAAEYGVDPNGYVMFCPCMGKRERDRKAKFFDRQIEIFRLKVDLVIKPNNFLVPYHSRKR